MRKLSLSSNIQGIYRQRMVHKSKAASLEPKMLLLCIFLVSCCLPGSMGGAAEEFQENFKALVALANKEVFLPVPKGKFQCSHVPCQLEKTIEALKVSFKNNPATTYVSRMEKNMDHITSTLKKTHTQPKNTMSCQTRELSLQTALERFRKYFQKVNENCWES